MRLVLLSMFYSFALFFIASTQIFADPPLASHLQKPFSDTGSYGYHDRFPWAVTLPPEIDWMREFKPLERDRSRQYQEDLGEREQKQLYQKEQNLKIYHTNYRVEALIGQVNRDISPRTNRDK